MYEKIRSRQSVPAQYEQQLIVGFRFVFPAYPPHPSLSV